MGANYNLYNYINSVAYCFVPDQYFIDILIIYWYVYSSIIGYTNILHEIPNSDGILMFQVLCN